MITSIHFRVRKWEHNPSIDLSNKPKTDVQVGCHPLTMQGSKQSEGLCFIWNLKLTTNGQVALEYESEEYFKITNKNVSNNELGNIALTSYRRTKQEVIGLNVEANIDATFPPFESLKIHKQYEGMREMLNTKY